MRNFTAFCLLALGAAAVKIESQGSFDDSLTQLRSDGLEFVSSIADAIEEAQDSDEGSDRDERLSSSSEDESDDSDDGAQVIGLADPFGNETDI